MLEIKPVQEKNEQERACLICGIEYNADMLSYAAYENGDVKAASQFKIEKDYGIITDVRTAKGLDDREAYVLTGKAILNFLDLCGIKKAYFKPFEKQDEEYALSIGFKKEEDALVFTIEGYFTNEEIRHSHN